MIDLFPTKVLIEKSNLDMSQVQADLNSIWKSSIETVQDNNYGFMKGDAVCSYLVHRELHNLPEFAEVAERFTMLATQYCKLMSYSIKPRIHEMWSNLYKAGSFIEMHNHAPRFLTATLYVKKPKDASNIFLKNPNEVLLKFQPLTITKLYEYPDSFEQEMVVEEGDMIAFPGYINHRTKPCKSVEDRMTISVDFMY
jgi:uncharacterized protein (TIGR02466 family)